MTFFLPPVNETALTFDNTLNEPTPTCMKHRYPYYLLILALVLNSCLPQIDFQDSIFLPLKTQRFVAIGDGYTAGVANKGWSADPGAGISPEFQRMSYPNLLASAFNPGGESAFRQPLVTGNGGYQQLKSYYPHDCAGVQPLPAIEWVPGQAGGVTVPSLGTVDNLGVPGLRLSDWLATSPPDAANPAFFDALVKPQTHLLGMVSAQEADFFSLWLGMEDLTQYAASGAAFPYRQPVDPNEFAQRIDTLISLILARNPGSRVLVANLPDITLFPYFQHMPHLYQESQECVRIQKNLFIETDQGVRIASPEDLILLPAQKVLGQPVGSEMLGLTAAHPLADSLVLDEMEVIEIKQLLVAYNQAIETVVNARRGRAFIELVDLNRYFGKMANGPVVVDGIQLSRDYLTGDVFSLDGLTLAPRGTAWMVNEFIRAINGFSALGARLSTLNLSDYQGITFP